jgi:hypothetical protein
LALSITDWKKEQACQQERNYLNDLYSRKGTWGLKIFDVKNTWWFFE